MNMSRNGIQLRSTSTECIPNLPLKNLLILHQLKKGKVQKSSISHRSNKQTRDGYFINDSLNRLFRSDLMKEKRSKSQLNISQANKSVIVAIATVAQKQIDERKKLEAERSKRQIAQFFFKSEFIVNKKLKGNSHWANSRLKLMKEKSRIRNNDFLNDESSMFIDKYHLNRSVMVNSVFMQGRSIKKINAQEKISKCSKSRIDFKLPKVLHQAV